MAPSTTTRIAFWLGLGALAAVAAIPSALHAQTGAVPPVAAPPASVTPPPAISPQDLAFGRFIATIRAHLLTGDELASHGEWDVASRHFSFPTEEIYGIIRDEVRTYHTPPFDGALKALVRTARAHSAKQYPKARQKVDEALAAADAGLKAREPNWPRFTLAVAIQVLKAAPDEYDDAVENGLIVRRIGYQTARGLVLQSDRMVESVAGQLAPGNEAALAGIRAGFAQLKQALAALNPAKRPVMDNAAVAKLVAGIDTAAAKLM